MIQPSNYRLIRLLGKGGFVEVHLGEPLHLSTDAVIKILHAQLTRNNIERFRSEARTITPLEHPHSDYTHRFSGLCTQPFRCSCILAASIASTNISEIS